MKGSRRYARSRPVVLLLINRSFLEEELTKTCHERGSIILSAPGSNQVSALGPAALRPLLCCLPEEISFKPHAANNALKGLLYPESSFVGLFFNSRRTSTLQKMKEARSRVFILQIMTVLLALHARSGGHKGRASCVWSISTGVLRGRESSWCVEVPMASSLPAARIITPAWR